MIGASVVNHLGSGGFKRAYLLDNDDVLLVWTHRAGRGPMGELKDLRKLASIGINVRSMKKVVRAKIDDVDGLRKIYSSDDTDIGNRMTWMAVVDRYLFNDDDIIYDNIDDGESLLRNSAVYVKRLDWIKQQLRDEKMYVGDLQFGFYDDGLVKIVDPITVMSVTRMSPTARSYSISSMGDKIDNLISAVKKRGKC